MKDSTSVVEVHEAYLAAAPEAQIFVGSPSFLLGSLRAGSRGGDDAERLQEEVRAAEKRSPRSRRSSRSSAASPS